MKAKGTTGAARCKNIGAALIDFLKYRKTHWEKTPEWINWRRRQHPNKPFHVISFWDGDGIPAELNAKSRR